MVSSVVGFLFVCSLAWKFSCTIHYIRMHFLSPYPLLLSTVSPPEHGFHHQDAIFLINLSPSLSSIRWDFKYLFFSSFPWEGFLWHACAHSVPRCLRLLSASSFNVTFLPPVTSQSIFTAWRQSACPCPVWVWLYEVNVDEASQLPKSSLLPALLVCFIQ